MEHLPKKQTPTDLEFNAKFLAYHVGIGTRCHVINNDGLIQVRAELAHVLGPNSTWMTCTVCNGSWTFENDHSSAHIPHEHLYTHGILGILSY